MKCLDLFHKVVDKYPEKTAVVDFDGKRSTSYRVLDELSGRVAGKLRSLGCEKGRFVVLEFDRRVEYYAAILGVLKAGCAYVPVVPSYPEERIKYICSDCNAFTVLTIDFFDDIENYDMIFDPADDSDPAFLIYTSGSTGKPKGIVHTVKGFAAAIPRWQHISGNIDGFTAVTMSAFSFVASTREFFTYVTNAVCIHLISSDVFGSIENLAGYINSNKIDMANLSTNMLRLIHKKDVCLKRVMTGSELVSGIYTDRYEIRNVYGMSETLSSFTYFILDQAYDNTPLGKAPSDMTIHIVDENGNECGENVQGEILVEGCFDASYFHNPELTGKTFEKLADGKTLLHTGDIGFMDENGDLVFVSRKDWMVKVNGQRVELLEVERKINELPGVVINAVRSFTDSNGQTYIASYYTSESDPGEEQLRKGLSEKLPEYMVPRYFVRLDSLPRTVSGKIDRSSLKAPDASAMHAGYEAPENEAEEKLCAAFENVLGCGKTGRNDDFFRLGGDSIKVLMLLDRAEIRSLSPDMILLGRTPARIAELCEGSEEHEIVRTGTGKKIYPLTSSQLGIYFECLSEPDSVKYNIVKIMNLPDDIDTEKFMDAVRAAVKVHKALSVTVGSENDIPSMILSDMEAEISEVSADCLSDELAKFIKPHDLEKGPLFRFEICHHSEGTAFLLDVHHIIFDGTSLNVLTKDIARAYNGESLPEEQLTLFDVSEYETGIRDTGKYKAAQEFYSREFSDVDCETSVVSDRTEPDRILHGAETFTRSTGMLFDTDKVNSYCRSSQITPNTLFLGAFAYTLAMFAGSDKCCFTAANNGRHNPGLAGSVGMFVKILPLHFEFDGNCRIDEFLSAAQKYFFESMKHDCISFSELANEYGLNNNISFVYQADLFEGADFGGSRIALEGVENGEVQSDLVVMMIKKGSGYTAYAHYRKELYSSDLVGSFINTYVNVINSMMESVKISDIDFLDDSTVKVLDSFNSTEAAYDRSLSVVDMFSMQAEKTPDNTAVIFGDRHYSYRELDELSDKVCVLLKSYDVGKGDVVSVLISRGIYMPAVSLGVLKTGAAYQPLDPTYPAERLSFMTDDASVGYLVADRHLVEKIPDFRGKIVFTDEIESVSVSEKPSSDISPEDLLVLLYTSGSTGAPKGCMMEHGNLTCFINWYRRFYGIDETSRVAAYASYGFDACLMDMYPVLTAGGATVIIPEDARMNMAALKEIFETAGVTHSFLTTQIGRMFAIDCKASSLKHLSIGGEKLIPFEPPKDYAFYNVYGPTECTIFSSAFRQEKMYTRVPIGRQLDNMKFYVTDANMRRLPLYMPGELCISGPQVTRGYLNRPEKTQSVFLENPFCSDPDYSRLYRSGDVVRMLNDGNIDFIGRNDNQIKIRGFRVELDEVENRILSFSNVNVVKVVMRNNGVENYLAAFIVSKDGKQIPVKELREHMKQTVPEYMIPAFIVQLEKMPLNANGKIDAKKLPDTEESMPERQYTAPETPAERDFCEIFAEVLAQERTGAEDDFFELGGTSLSAIRVVTHASSKGYNILYRDIFRNSTPRMLAKLAEEQKTESDDSSGNVLADYDYSKINRLLEKNSMENVDSFSQEPLGNIILTGPTGFLGIHILHDFLENYAGKVYCLMRKDAGKDSGNRLRSMLMYYFGKSYSDLFGSRIICMDGDITDRESLKALEGLPAGTVINAAACVKHFANDDILDRVNSEGVRNLCEMCVGSGRKLVHISTISTAGIIRNRNEFRKLYLESDLYFGQTIDSAYSKSKFMGERALLEYKAEKGLEGYIIRVGNLMPRESDGEFQINFMTNNFLGVMRAYTKFGKFPMTAMNNAADFSPIDCTAASVLRLASVKSEFSVFHAYNNHRIFMADVIYVLRRLGFDMSIVSAGEFDSVVEKAKQDDSMSNEILRLTAYLRNDDKFIAVDSGNRFTTEVLYRLGYKWPIIDESYLENAVRQLEGLRFFR